MATVPHSTGSKGIELVLIVEQNQNQSQNNFGASSYYYHMITFGFVLVRLLEFLLHRNYFEDLLLEADAP